MIKFIFENVSMAVVGLLTGGFVGGLVLGGGMTGAVIGGLTGAALLVLMNILCHFTEWHIAQKKMKYASVGILPGVLIGGSLLLGFGVPGAVIFGIANAIVFATLIDQMVENHAKKKRYVLYRGHYFVLFLLGSIGTFVTINIIGIVNNFVDIEALVAKLPFFFIVSMEIGAGFIVCLVGLAIKKRKQATWSQAVKASKKMFFILAGIVALLMIVSTLIRFAGIPIAGLVLAITGLVIPYAVGLVLPLSLGYLLASNTNRPIMGSVFSLVGGLLVLLVGISVAPVLLLPGSGLMWAGLMIGLFMVMLSIFGMAKPDSHLFTGCSIIVFSILSFIGAAGGLVVGGLLGLAGGTLIAAWNGGYAKPVGDDPDLSKGKDIPAAPSNTISG